MNNQATNDFTADLSDLLAARADQVPLHNSAAYQDARGALDRIIARVEDAAGKGAANNISDTVTELVYHVTHQAYEAGYRDGIQMNAHSLAK